MAIFVLRMVVLITRFLGGSCTGQAPPPVLILTETFLRDRPLSGAKVFCYTANDVPIVISALT